MEYEWRSKSTSSASSSNSRKCHGTSDGHIGKTIREKLRKHRPHIIGFLQESLTPALLNALLDVQFITRRQISSVQRRHHQAEKASHFMDIIASKRDTDLKVFVDVLRIHCPAAHNMLHEPDYENDGGEKAYRNAIEKTQECRREKGSDINLKHKQRFTTLHTAVSSGSMPNVEATLKASAPGDVESLLYARTRYRGYDQRFVVQGYANEHTAWHYVEVDRARIDIFQRHIQESECDVVDYGTVLKSGWGDGPLATIIQEIEDRLDMLNIWQETLPDQQPLHLGIMINHEAVSLKLISIMEDVDQPDYFGLTPLHLAAMRGNVRVINALLEKGANSIIQDHHGRTPCDIAISNKHPAAISALERAKARSEPVSEELKQKLTSQHLMLVTDITPNEELYGYLLQSGTLNYDEIDEIKINATRAAQVRRLLKRISLKSCYDYKCLKDALLSTGQEHVAELL